MTEPLFTIEVHQNKEGLYEIDTTISKGLSLEKFNKICSILQPSLDIFRKDIFHANRPEQVPKHSNN